MHKAPKNGIYCIKYSIFVFENYLTTTPQIASVVSRSSRWPGILRDGGDGFLAGLISQRRRFEFCSRNKDDGDKVANMS